MTRPLSLVAAAALAGCAAAATPGMEAAMRIVDRAQPLRCEAAALEGRLKAAEPGSAEAAGLAASLEQAKSRLKWHYMATMDEYIAVMKELPFEDRKAIYRYSDEAAGRCAGGSG